MGVGVFFLNATVVAAACGNGQTSYFIPIDLSSNLLEEVISVEHQARLFLAIAFAAWLPAVVPWLALPSAVLEILLGVVLGPHGLNLDHAG